MRTTITKMTKNLYSQQSKLPRLPVPALEETIEKYLDCSKPFLNNVEYDHNQKLLNNFKETQGKVLQSRLVERFNEKENWLIDWWNSQGYLQPRDPVCPFVNYYFYHRQLLGDNQVNVAANLLKATLTFKGLVDNEVLDYESIKGTPLCSSAYHYLFNSTRLPLKNSDQSVKFDKSNQHVIVISNNRFFRLNADNFDNLENQLEQIVKLSSDKKGLPIGVLTTENRDVWSDARTHIQGISNENSDNLNDIDSSAIILALDDSAPITREQGSWGAWAGDGRNRWFDKHQS